MINNFPEIKAFFKSSRFLKEDLDNFICETNSKYSDKEVKKQANSLINLQLLKFEILSKDDNLLHENFDCLNLNEENKYDKQFVGRIQNDFKNEQKTKKAYISNAVFQFENKKLSEVAKALMVKKSTLISLIERKGFLIDGNGVISKDIIKVMRNWMNNKLNIQYRQEKKNRTDKIKVVKTKGKSKSKYDSVYSKLEEIHLGKLIYIRSKS